MSKKETIFTPKTIKRFQWLNWPLFRTIAQLTVHDKNIKLRPEQLNENTNYVIVSNHQGTMDPFIVCYNFSRKLDKTLVPVHFFTANRFMLKPVITQWLALMGSFPAKRHDKYPYGLIMAEHLVGNGQTVMIFPEGKVSQIEKEHTPKHGVEVLARMPNVKLIPSHVKWDRNKGFFKAYSLAIGKPFDGSNMSAEQIMDKVYSLKFK